MLSPRGPAVVTFALTVLCHLAPLPADGARLFARSALKSEDGKHEAQLATFGFPMSKKDAELLGTVMNSDPYLHHFRPKAVYLTVGEKTYPGGPRLTTWHGIVLPGLQQWPLRGW